MSKLEKSEFKSKILIGKHNITCNEQTYGRMNTRGFDGYHMHGPKGSESYTKSLISILSQNLQQQPKGVNFQPSGNQKEILPEMKQTSSHLAYQKENYHKMKQIAIQPGDKIHTSNHLGYQEQTSPLPHYQNHQTLHCSSML